MEIEKLRQEIDGLDDKMVKLFVERMGLSALIAEEKKKTGKAVTDKSREGEILFRLLSSAPEEFSVYIKELYETVFVLSRAYQSTLIGAESKTVKEIRALIEKGEYKTS